MPCFRFCITKAGVLVLLFIFACAAKISAAEFNCADDQLQIYQDVGTDLVVLVGSCAQSPVIFFSRIYRGPPVVS